MSFNYNKSKMCFRKLDKIILTLLYSVRPLSAVKEAFFMQFLVSISQYQQSFTACSKHHNIL